MAIAMEIEEFTDIDHFFETRRESGIAEFVRSIIQARRSNTRCVNFFTPLRSTSQESGVEISSSTKSCRIS
ncbi:MAG: hypothetical protein ACRYFY_22780 [Janthinobacterium lividum]